MHSGRHVVKEAHNHHDHREKDGASRLVFAIFFNGIITAAEFIGGFLSGSLALISDAGHNLSDVLSLALGLAGEKMAHTKPGRVYTFGLKRVEVAIAFANALSLVVIAAYILHEAIQRYYHPVEIHTAILLPVACIGLAGNAVSILLLHRHRHASLNMKAAFLHLLFDTISSVGVVIVGIAMLFWNAAMLDLVIALVIVVMIAYSSFGIIRESFRIFMQGAPRGMDVQMVQKSIAEVEGVSSVHGLHIWSVSSSEVFLSCHICLDVAMPKLNTDELITRINRMLRTQFGIHHTTIQIEKERMCGLGSDAECCR